MIKVQMIAVLRVTRAYGTVSADTALFLTGTPPGNLLALERKKIRLKIDDPSRFKTAAEIRRVKRDITLTTWANKWGHTNNAAWTRKILPNLRKWVIRRPKDLNFHVNRAVFSHGCFRYYLEHVEHVPNAECLQCLHPEYTAEHTLFTCPHWELFRWTARKFFGRKSIDIGNVQDLLCGPADIPPRDQDRMRFEIILAISSRSTLSFYSVVNNILGRKEKDEREAHAVRRGSLLVG